MRAAEEISQWLLGTSNAAAVRDTRNGCRGTVRRTLALVTVTLLCGVPGVRAQKDSGAIVGVVKGASGGVVAAASVVAIDVERGEKLPIREEMHVEFRTEFFNTFNHANPEFTNPETIVENTATELGSATFGFSCLHAPAVADPICPKVLLLTAK
jgi:hypothetical protein